jgi:predicted unusual protein kinase regulating ubiquinone biosynthesis (AarF/ABC1/UbiB family)
MPARAAESARAGRPSLVATLGRAAALLHVATAEAWGWYLGRRDAPEAVLRAIVRLGPTFIKLAQVASTRPDLVPPAVSERLTSLQEHAPPVPFEEVRGTVEREIGRPLGELFRSFPHEPVAAASIAQVHLAELTDGTPVAVKVQRPGIRPLVERDLAVLTAVAHALEIVWPLARRLGVVRAVREFGRWTLAELDFRVEAANLAEFRTNFDDEQDVLIPAVFPALSGERVLTLERVEGIRVGEVSALRGSDEAHRLARRLVEIELKMFVADAFFHADLHPGNVFFTSDGRIALLDVGMVGRLAPRERDRFLAYWIAISRRRRDRAFAHLTAMAESTTGADLGGYRAAYDTVLDRFYDSDPAATSLARTYLEVVALGARFGVVFPPGLLLQAKAVVTAEALTSVLAADFRFTDEVRPIVARELARRATPARLRDRAWEALPEWVLFGEIEGDTGPAEPDHADERAFRRAARIALADVWSDAAGGSLTRAEDELLERSSARWWRRHPESRALLRTGLAIVRGVTAELARVAEDEPSSVPARPGPPARAAALAHDLVALLDRLDREVARWHEPGHWERRAAMRAGLLGMTSLLRLHAGVAARAIRERGD